VLAALDRAARRMQLRVIWHHHASDAE
jgi:hypothetical protein